MGITVTRDGYVPSWMTLAQILLVVSDNIAAGHEPRIIFDILDFKISKF